MARSLKFAYPGGKGNLSKTILSLMPSDGERFVDVFAGRGNVTWAVMSLHNYRRFWINALGTINFFKELRWLGPAPAAGPLTIRERTRKYYEGSKKESLQAYLATSIPEFERLGATRLVDMLKRGQKLASRDEMASPLSPVTEAYLSYNGGTYSSTGPMNDKGGGVSRKGMIAKMHQAGLMLEQNWNRIKLTALDYRKVLAQCTSRDMVYL